jgi:hypothetical protein
MMDSGYQIAASSPEIQGRFRLSPAEEIPQILIKDREDYQGIELIGKADEISGVLGVLRELLLDAALLKFEPLEESRKELGIEPEVYGELSQAWVEFGGSSKEVLDRIRSSVVPTLARHHRLRIIHPKGLDRAERQLGKHPQLKEELERTAFQEGILGPLSKAGLFMLEHIKISGKPVRPREGVLLKAEGSRILVRRVFSRGRYDGLDLAIQEGDYGFTEAEEGAWQVKHAYYSREGKLKGEYYNINTPVELYPYGARYLDLEIDVIRRAGEGPCIVDREDLAILAKEGRISSTLEKRALEEAERLAEKLRRAPSPHPSPPRRGRGRG